MTTRALSHLDVIYEIGEEITTVRFKNEREFRFYLEFFNRPDRFTVFEITTSLLQNTCKLCIVKEPSLHAPYHTPVQAQSVWAKIAAVLDSWSTKSISLV